MEKINISKTIKGFAYAAGALVLFTNIALSAEMPKNPRVQSGNVTIEGTGTDHLRIQQSTNKSIINWDSFSVHKGGRVDFKMPSSKSSSLNRVTGSTPSSIAGQINSNGRVLLINPNGVAITKNGVIKTGSFAASTLDIKNNDFLKDIYTFKKKNNSNGIENSGKIIVGNGGNASLLGGYVNNSGTILAKLGKVSLGSGDQITLDFVGDGLMKITIPTNKLGSIKDTRGRPLSSLIKNTGLIRADGGLIELSAHTAQALSRGSVNIGSSGMLIAKPVNDMSGKIVIGSPKDNAIKITGKIDVSRPITSISPSGTVVITGKNITHRGNIYASGRSGGKVKILSKENIDINGNILAKGIGDIGGDIVFMSEKNVKIGEKSIVDVSGQNKGGTIRSLAKVSNYTSGTLKASSKSGYGGRVDITGESVEVSNTDITASGKRRGGKVRIGGEYLGGKLTKLDKKYEGFVSRFGNQPKLNNAKQTIVKADTNVDVSSQTGKGGTVVIWSDQVTEFDGTINAKGAEKVPISGSIDNYTKFENSGKDPPYLVPLKNKTKIESTVDPPPPKTLLSLSKSSVDPPQQIKYEKGGGFVEISSEDYLKRANIEGVSLNGGSLLLDPRNIYVRDSSLGGTTLTSDLTNVDQYADGGTTSYRVNSSIIESAITSGTNVILKAQRNIYVQSDIIATGSSGGDLTLNAGVDINISANITTANGNLSLEANNESISGRGNNRYSDIDISSTVNLGTGDLNITLGNSNTTGSYDINLSSATINANNITITDSATNNSHPSDLGNFTASSAINVTSANKYLNVNGATLTANGTGTAVDITSKYLSGSGSVSTPNGIWRAVNTETSTFGGFFGGFTGNFIQYGYSSGDAILGTGSGLLSAYDPGNLSKVYGVFSGTSFQLTKTYDGTNSTASASFFTSSPTVSGASGAVPTGTSISLSSPTFTYDDVNQGNQTVTGDAAYSITSQTHTNFSNIFGLTTSASAPTLTGRISRKSIQIQGEKYYDATTDISAAADSEGFGGLEIIGLIAGEDLQFSAGTDNFFTMVADPGDTYTTFNMNNISLTTGTGSGGVAGDPNNYSVSSTLFRIKPRPLKVKVTRQYDTSSSFDSDDTVFFEYGTMGSPPSNAATKTGVFNETLALSGTGTISGGSSDVGTGYTVTGMTLSDGFGAASNYTIDGSVEGDITRKVVNVSGSRADDGTTAIASSVFDTIETGTGQTLNLSGSATAAQSTPGIGITVNTATPGLTLLDGSGSASNYTLTGGTHTVDITATSAYITGSKVYDSFATVNSSVLSLVDPSNPGASVTITGSGTASSANAANGIQITSANLGTLALSGADAGSYDINTIALNGYLTINIEPKTVNLSGTRLYDGTTDAAAADLSVSSGTIGTQSLTISGTGSLNAGGAGTRIISDVSGLSLGNGSNGGIGANYTLDSGTHNLTINPLPLTITGTKVYDGDNEVHASTAEAQIQNVISGENILFSGIANSDSEDVGTGVNIGTVGTWTLTDQTHAASNYTFTGGNLNIDITQREIKLTGTKTYDGNTNVDGSTITRMTAQGTYTAPGDPNNTSTFSSGLVSSGVTYFLPINVADGHSSPFRETLTISGTGTANSKDVTSANILSSNGTLALADGSNGGKASNYKITLSSGSHEYTVTQKPLGLSGSKVYDGTDVVLASELPTISGLIGSETVVPGSQTVTAGSTATKKNVANNVTITSNAAGITLADGSNGGLASNYTLTGGTHEVNITKAPITIGLTRQYDGTTNASSNATDSNTTESYSGLVGSETLTLTGQGSVASKNVSGSSQSVTMGTIALGNQSGATTSSGGLASNYNLTSAALTINQKVLNSNSSRIYNATTAAAASDITLTNQISGETLQLSNAAATSSANVGSYSISNLSGITISDEAGANASSGALAANYTLTGGTHTFAINRKSVNIEGTRQYDGTTNIPATDISSITDTVNSEVLSMSGGIGTTSSANVGVYDLVNTSQGTLTLANGPSGANQGLASNYTLTGGTQDYTITQRVLNSSGSKTYDANTDALAADITLSNLVSGETLTHSGTATLSSANAGSYTITNLSGVSLADNAGLASNYTLTGGTHNFTVNPKVVSIQGNKTYDGNTTINTSDITAIVDTVGSETLVISSGTGTTSSPNTATYASAGINEGSLTLGDGTGLASNYTLTGHAVSSFQINQRVLSSLGSREYDGTSTVSSSDLTLSNLVGSEILTLSGNGTLADVNVAINKTVTLNTLSIADNTGLASNYTLTGGTHQLNITQRSVTLSGTRSYDGTNTVSNSDLTIGNLAGSETLTLTGAGTVASKDVGSNKSVTDLSFGLSDNTGLASNYMIGTKTFNITKQTITIDGSKIYDGNTTAAASDISTFNGLALSETLTINGSGTIATPSVGTNKVLTLGTLTLADGSNGGESSNYDLTSGTFDVTTRPITLSGSRVYDGTTTVANTDITTFANIVSGEALAVTGSGTIADQNVGTSKSVSLGTLALADNTGSASNYSLSSATFDVNQRPLNLSATKAYDANTTVNSGSVTLSNLVGVETLNTSGSITTNSNNVGTFGTSDINVSSLSLIDGTGTASNYTLSGGTYSATITKKTIGLTGSKVYDATTTASSSNLSLTGLVGSETLTLSGTGTLATSAVGTGKTITLNTLAIADNTGLASNYDLSGTAAMDVTTRSVTASGSRVYDGTTTVNGTDLTTINNLAGTDTLSLTGSGTTTANVGNSKSVALGTLALASGSGNASNYALSSATVDVTQRPLDLEASRIYDGTTTINGLDFSTFTNIVGGETLAVTGSGTIASQNVGTGKTVTSVNLALTNGTGIASNYSINSLTADITGRPVTISGSRSYDSTVIADSSILTITSGVSGENLTLTGSGVLGAASAGPQTITNNNTLAIADGTGLASNYTLAGATINVTVLPRTLNVTLSREYDGTTSVSGSSLTPTFDSLQGGETLALTGTGSISNANVGSSKAVTLGTIALASGSGNPSNYTLNSATMDVTQKVINLDGIRAYDASTDVLSSDINTFGNIVSGETLTISGTGTVPNNSVEMNKVITLGSLTLGDGSGSASNYTLIGGTHTFDITPLSVNITGNRQYDGTNVIDSSDLLLSNLLTGETVSLSGQGTVASADVGADKTVTSVNLALTGPNASNYTLGSYTTNFEILPKVIDLTGTKVYDGQTTVPNANLTFTTGISGESLGLKGSGSVISAAVGTGKSISLGTLQLDSIGSGLDSNYTLSGGTHTFDITTRALTFTSSRNYDGTTIANTSSLTFSLSNLVTGETLSMSGSGTVVSKDVSAGTQNITLGTIALVDNTGVASNYSLTSGTMDINQKQVNLSGTKVYDTNSTLNNSIVIVASGLVGSETLGLTGDVVTNSANVGTYLESAGQLNVGSTTIALADGTNGGLGNNYSINEGTFTITQRAVTISGTRVYDGSKTVSSSDITTFNNTAGGETLTLSGSGTFLESEGVGSGKTINVTGLTLGNGTGTASNYSLSGGSFAVTPRSVTLTTSRNFDNSKDVDSTNLSVIFNNLVGSETLSLSGLGSVSSENVATGQQSVTLGTLTLTDNTGVASNYLLSSATLDINEKPISLSGTKVYDSLTTAASSALTISGTVGGQDLTLSGNGTLATGADAGTNKTINTTGLSLGDGVSGTPGTASNYSFVGGTHQMSVTQKPVTISGSRFYDSTTNVSSSDINTFNNTVGGQTLAITGSGSVSTALAGSGKTISLGTLTLTDGTGLASNYSLSSGTFDINSRQVNISGSRVYDGTTNVSGSDLTVTTGVGSEILTLSGTGSIASAIVGNGKSVTTGTLALNNGSGNSNNYTMGSITLDITKRTVNVDFEKTYDATTSVASSDLKSNGITNTVLGHSLSLSGSGVMTSAGVGVDKTLSVGSLSLTGVQASNYTLSGGDLTIDVNPRLTNASGSRHYDGSLVAQSSVFSTFSNVVGSDTVTLRGRGTITTTESVGPKGVAVGTLESAHPNYILGSASLVVTQRPVNLSGSRIAKGKLIVDSRELSISNLANNENLVLSGSGSINQSRPGTSQRINLLTLSISNGSGPRAGLVSNYTLIGGSHFMRLRHKLTHAQRIRNILNAGVSGKSVVRTPSRTTHRRVPAVAERISISTPDQSIEVSPCVLKNGYCN